MAIRVCTLPGVRILAPAGEVTGLQGRGLPLALLVYLGVERSASRDTLLPLFWPDRDEDRARHSLSQTLYEIRRELGSSEWLAASGDVLAVAASVECDVARFEAAVESGKHAQALDLYGGGFLEGLHLFPTRAFEDWVDRRRGQVARLHRRARREVVSERLRAGDVNGALALAARWAELEPLDDEAQQRTIELLARTGRRADALRQYELFREQLRREELEPMPELEQLATSIRTGETGAPAPVEAPAAGSGPLPGLAPDLEIVRLLAEGRNARVYLAREPLLGRLVAIKVLTPDSQREATIVRRFEREARAVARIRHPNVAPLYRIGVLANGAHYLVMPYIDGGTLEDRLAARGRLPLPDACRVIAQLASALAAAHHAGIVHRDVRPGNVLYDRESDRVMLVDFGTAGLLEAGDLAATRLTRPGEALGLPAYASPEQLRGDVATDRSDVYSLGIVGFEILTGRLPFQATTPLEMTAAHLDAEPPRTSSLRPDVEPELDELVRRCLNKRPEQRPFAAEVAEALEAQPRA